MFNPCQTSECQHSSLGGNTIWRRRCQTMGSGEWSPAAAPVLKNIFQWSRVVPRSNLTEQVVYVRSSAAACCMNPSKSKCRYGAQDVYQPYSSEASQWCAWPGLASFRRSFSMIRQHDRCTKCSCAAAQTLWIALVNCLDHANEDDQKYVSVIWTSRMATDMEIGVYNMPVVELMCVGGAYRESIGCVCPAMRNALRCLPLSVCSPVQLSYANHKNKYLNRRPTWLTLAKRTRGCQGISWWQAMYHRQDRQTSESWEKYLSSNTTNIYCWHEMRQCRFREHD